MTPSSKIYVAGHRGMAGSAAIRELGRLGYENVLTAGRSELDLTSGGHGGSPRRRYPR
jgi:GDP-L-fucose synthase